MVRTLVFHTNNVGSIPTGLNMLSNWLFYKTDATLTPRATTPKILRYSLRFASLVSPWGGEFSSKFSQTDTRVPKSRRVAFKKSYLVASWLKYLTFQKFGLSTNKSPSIAILPSKSRCFTLTKAPMAHKTNSKEQFMFNFYNFKFSASLAVTQDVLPKSVAQGGHVLQITKKLFPVFETNLLFLKYYRVSYPIKDRQFFSKLT